MSRRRAALASSARCSSTTLEIEIDARGSPAPWTAFGYVAFRRLE